MNQKLGNAFIPFTFPTDYVLREVKKLIPYFDWSLGKIDDIYLYYKDYVLKGGQIYDVGNTKVVDDVSKNTGYGVGEVRIVLATIRNLAKEGKIDLEYWKISKPDTSITKSVSSQIASFTPDITGLTKNIKWIGIIALIGVGIYITYPWLKKLTKVRA